MPLWLAWLIVAVVLCSAETLSGDFVLFMLGVGAAAATVTAAAGGPVGAQVAVGLVVAIALVLFVRPIAKRHFLTAHLFQTGTSALVGKAAVVLVDVNAQDGRIRLNGAEWSARAMNEHDVYTAGSKVRVVQIAGATAIVYDDPTV